MIAIAAVLVVATIATPCAIKCCALSSAALRMMALMPCCNGGERIHSDMSAPSTPDATLVRTTDFSPSAQHFALLSTAIVAHAQPSPVAVFNLESPCDSAGGAPPLFLRNAQFRI